MSGNNIKITDDELAMIIADIERVSKLPPATELEFQRQDNSALEVTVSLHDLNLLLDCLSEHVPSHDLTEIVKHLKTPYIKNKILSEVDSRHRTPYDF